MNFEWDLGKVAITIAEQPWSSSIRYERLTIVKHDGISYLSRIDNQGVEPGTDDTVWTTYLGAGTQAAVLYDREQSLSSAQKSRARLNINVPSTEDLNNKVDKIEGKGLSTNDYTNIDKQLITNALLKTSQILSSSEKAQVKSNLGFIEEAPSNNTIYGRKNGNWVEVEGGSGGNFITIPFSVDAETLQPVIDLTQEELVEIYNTITAHPDTTVFFDGRNVMGSVVIVNGVQLTQANIIFMISIMVAGDGSHDSQSSIGRIILNSDGTYSLNLAQQYFNYPADTITIPLSADPETSQPYINLTQSEIADIVAAIKSVINAGRSLPHIVMVSNDLYSGVVSGWRLIEGGVELVVPNSIVENSGTLVVYSAGSINLYDDGTYDLSGFVAGVPIGEPSEYLKSASVSSDGDTLTLIKKDGTMVTFAPSGGGGGTVTWGHIGGTLADQLDLMSLFANYATQSWVNNQGFLKEHQSLNNYYTKLQTDSLIDDVRDDIPSLVGYATQDWVNDQGFLKTFTESDPTVPSYVKGIMASDINNWNSKQNALISGTNIKTINEQSILGSGNLTISGSSSVSYILDTTTQNVNVTLEENVIHCYKRATGVTSININLPQQSDTNIEKEYTVEFYSAGTPTQITYPSTIKWAENTPPFIESYKKYRLVFILPSGIGIWNSFPM